MVEEEDLDWDLDLVVVAPYTLYISNLLYALPMSAQMKI